MRTSKCSKEVFGAFFSRTTRGGAPWRKGQWWREFRLTGLCWHEIQWKIYVCRESKKEDQVLQTTPSPSPSFYSPPPTHCVLLIQEYFKDHLQNSKSFRFSLSRWQTAHWCNCPPGTARRGVQVFLISSCRCFQSGGPDENPPGAAQRCRPDCLLAAPASCFASCF